MDEKRLVDYLLSVAKVDHDTQMFHVEFDGNTAPRLIIPKSLIYAAPVVVADWLITEGVITRDEVVEAIA